MLDDYRAIVPDYVRDDSNVIDSTDSDQAILAAVGELDSVSPNDVFVELTEASATKNFSLPGDWVSGFSRISQVEYPTAQVPPVLLSADDFMTWQTPSGDSLILSSEIPASEPIWIKYSRKYILTEVADDIPERFRQPVSLFAASLLCDQMAAFYAGESDSNFTADVASFGSKSQEFRTLANKYRTKFYSFFGAATPKATTGPSAASKIITLSPISGITRFSH